MYARYEVDEVGRTTSCIALHCGAGRLAFCFLFCAFFSSSLQMCLWRFCFFLFRTLACVFCLREDTPLPWWLGFCFLALFLRCLVGLMDGMMNE